MDAEKTVWCIAITFADTEKNGFVSLGGAGWETQAEWGIYAGTPENSVVPHCEH